jgi:hypothetical protein
VQLVLVPHACVQPPPEQVNSQVAPATHVCVQPPPSQENLQF